MIKLMYFASLSERLSCREEELELPEVVANVDSLKAFLSRRDESWHDAFTVDQSILASVNQEMVKGDFMVKDGDEIGFFPPVTGG